MVSLAASKMPAEFISAGIRMVNTQRTASLPCRRLATPATPDAGQTQSGKAHKQQCQRARLGNSHADAVDLKARRTSIINDLANLGQAQQQALIYEFSAS